jgi:hypothetical protein
MGNLKMNDFSESLFCVDIGSTDFPKGWWYQLQKLSLATELCGCSEGTTVVL